MIGLIVLMTACGPKLPVDSQALQSTVYTAPPPAVVFPQDDLWIDVESSGEWTLLIGHGSDFRQVMRTDGSSQQRPIPPGGDEDNPITTLFADGAVAGIEKSADSAPTSRSLMSAPPPREPIYVVVRELDGSERYRVELPIRTYIGRDWDRGSRFGSPQLDAAARTGHVVVHYQRQVGLLNPSGEWVWQRELEREIEMVRISPDASRIVLLETRETGRSSGGVVEVSPADGVDLATYAAVERTDVRPSGRAWWVGDALLVSTAQGMSKTGNGLAEWSSDGTLSRCESSADGMGFVHHAGQDYLFGSSGTVRRWTGCDAEPESVASLTPPFAYDPTRWVRGMVSTPSGLKVLSRTRNLWPVSEDWTVPDSVPRLDTCERTALSSNTAQIALVCPDYAQVFDVGATTGPVFTTDTPIQTAAFVDNDASLLITSDLGGPKSVLFNLTTGMQTELDADFSVLVTSDRQVRGIVDDVPGRYIAGVFEADGVKAPCDPMSWTLDDDHTAVICWEGTLWDLSGSDPAPLGETQAVDSRSEPWSLSDAPGRGALRVSPRTGRVRELRDGAVVWPENPLPTFRPGGLGFQDVGNPSVADAPTTRALTNDDGDVWFFEPDAHPNISRDGLWLTYWEPQGLRVLPTSNIPFVTPSFTTQP